MQSLVKLLALAAATQLFLAPATADELWTYYFIPDGSRPYERGCLGDCTGGGTRADLAGSFSILIDWQALTGRVFAIDDDLVNTANWSGNFNNPQITPFVPPTPLHGYGPDDGIFGVHPLIFDEANLTSTANGWRLTSNGIVQLANGLIGSDMPYDVTFNATSATLSLNTGNHYFDYGVLTNAHAGIVSRGLAGDFNYDSHNDARDYVTWRNSAGSEVDYDLWRAGFGDYTSIVIVDGAATISVPEPATASLLLCGILACGCRRQR